MFIIDVCYVYVLFDVQVCVVIEQVVVKLFECFGLKLFWIVDVLNFFGSGVDGVIELQLGVVCVIVKLGFLLLVMKGMVEGEIQCVLKEKLG